MDSDEILGVDSEEDLDEVLRLPRALLYKHSTRCGTSVRAMLEVERFARGEADVPVFGIDVIRQRRISDLAAQRLGIGHESPQVILIRGMVARHGALRIFASRPQRCRLRSPEQVSD